MRTALLLGVLLLAGCSNNPADPDRDPGGYYGTTTVDTPSGPVLCVTWKSGYGGGVSCDWRR